MADVTGSIIVPSNLLLAALRKEIDLEDDTLKMGLSDDTYVPSVAHVDISNIVGELVGNGYARQTLANPTVSYSAPYIKLSFDNPSFTASGGNLVARTWWIFDDTHGSDILIAMGLIDTSNVDVTIIDGQPLVMNVNSLGLWRIGLPT